MIQLEHTEEKSATIRDMRHTSKQQLGVVHALIMKRTLVGGAHIK